MVTHIHRIIHTIGEKVITTNISSNTGDRIIRINPPTNLRIVITAGYIIEPGLGVVVIAAVTQGIDVPDEAGGGVLLAVFIVHGVVAPRAVGAAAQRDTADNDDDLWLCADGCTHHSDHLSIPLRAVQQHRPLTESPIFRATGRDFSLFCHSIRDLNTASTMIKIFCSIVTQTSVFHRKDAALMLVKPFSCILHLPVPIIYNLIRQVAERLSGHIENLICLRREKIAFVYLNSSIYVIPANVYCTCIVSIIYLHTQRHSCIVQDILL